MDSIRDFFSRNGFMPHGMCLAWRPEIFWLHAVSDTIIALSYYSIPLALMAFVARRRDIAFPWVFQLFGAFILACGTTHLMAVWTLWNPDFVIDGLIKAVTAGLSVTTAALLWPLMPRALQIPSPGQLESANSTLRHEIVVRQRAEDALRTLNEELELRVAARTAEIARREMTYRTIVESSLDAFILIAENGIVLEWNPSAEIMFGRPAADAVGLSIDDMIMFPNETGDQAGSFGDFLEASDQRSPGRRFEVLAVRRQGERFPVELRIAAINVENARVFSAFIRDLSEVREAEQKLAQAQKMEAIGQLTGGVAHDFNNLLTVVLGNSEALVERLSDRPELRHLAQLTLTVAERGAELTHRLLAFARRQALEPKSVDVNDLLSGMVPLLQRTLTEDIDIAFVPGADLWPAVIDPSQLEAAVLNLCINARDAMPGGGRLIVEAKNVQLDGDYAGQNAEVAAGDYVMVAVSDTGVGIAPDDLARVFDPFFTTKEVGKGTGLGLSMVYGFVKQSRGHVKVYSEVGVGTVVKLYLPRSDGAPGPVEKHEKALADLAGTEKILLVEDDDLVRAHAESVLTDLGYRVTVASNGPSALEAMKRDNTFDLLFTDVVMPGGMSGRMLADQAIILKPGLRVLYTSGYTQNSVVHDGQVDEGVLLLSKPYSRLDLAQKVRAALDLPIK